MYKELTEIPSDLPFVKSEPQSTHYGWGSMNTWDYMLILTFCGMINKLQENIYLLANMASEQFETTAKPLTDQSSPHAAYKITAQADTHMVMNIITCKTWEFFFIPIRSMCLQGRKEFFVLKKSYWHITNHQISGLH